jgi:hypothetical protein
MDPLITALTNLADSRGPVIAILVAVVFWLYQRDRRSDERMELQHRQCQERNAKLEDRIVDLEKRQYTEIRELAQIGMLNLDKVHSLAKIMAENGITPPPQSVIRKPT